MFTPLQADQNDVENKEQTTWKLSFVREFYGCPDTGVVNNVPSVDSSSVLDVSGSTGSSIPLTFKLVPVEQQQSPICSSGSVYIQVFSLFVVTNVSSDNDNLQYSVEVKVKMTGLDEPLCNNSWPPIVFRLKHAKEENGFCLIEEFAIVGLHGTSDQFTSDLNCSFENNVACLNADIHVRKLNSSSETIKKSALRDFQVMHAAENNFPDVKLKSKDGMIISGHKFVLAARSPYFRNILNDENIEDKEIIEVNHINAKPLLLLLQWMYTEQVECMQDLDSPQHLEFVQNLEVKLPKLLKGAALLELKEFPNYVDLLLKRFCCSDNMFSLAALAKKYGLRTSLKEICKFINENIDDYIEKSF